MNDRTAFKHSEIPIAQLGSRENLKLDRSYIWAYLRGTDNTPIRAVTDKAVVALMPYLQNKGVIIELGAGSDFYKNLAPADQRYMTSNLAPGFDLQLDMTNMALEDSSVEAFISLYAIEHIFDFKSTIQEVYRCLKSGGRYLLVSPFLYYYHAAPSDYFRFTMSALEQLFSSFNILYRTPLGNRELLLAEFYLELDIMGFERSAVSRFLKRMLGALFCAKGISHEGDPKFAAANLLLCEKP
jgi:SAM-dependent methyltransferase